MTIFGDVVSAYIVFWDVFVSEYTILSDFAPGSLDLISSARWVKNQAQTNQIHQTIKKHPNTNIVYRDVENLGCHSYHNIGYE